MCFLFSTSGMTKSSGCDPTRAYRNIDQIVKLDQDLYQDMNKYWPSKFGNNSAFWEYEWGKHGTCLSTIEPRCHHDYRKYDDMMNYFRIVMSLYKQHNIYEVLKQAQITPRHDVYKRVEFEHAIKEAFGVNAVLTCKGRSLKEIRLSFYMQGYDKFILINPDMSRSTCGHHIEYRHR
jgi:ribonuclease T2